MKKTVSSILFYICIMILTLTSCSPLSKSIDKKQNTLKILSYNVRNCRGMDNITDYKRIADVINRISPDIVAVQELDSATIRSNGIVALNQLSSLTNMSKTYSASISFQGGKYGIGILSRVEPIKSRVVALPGSEEKRSLLIAEFKDYIFCCTHFSLTEADRIASVDIINTALEGNSKPIFLAGDFNSVQGSEVITNVEKNWYMLNNPKNLTIPSNNPQKCIDFIFGAKFTGHTFQIKQSIVENEPVASDHLPVWVEVVID
jgi:endonuclease/exonuclease/phosphatase family metal-dependent hydrolase